MAFFFFFKQKTAYEMRISDWSSDVCSSDLQDDDEEVAELVEEQAPRRSARRLGELVGPVLRQPALGLAGAEAVGGVDVEVGHQVVVVEGVGGSEEGRVGKEGVRTCRTRWLTYD